MVSGTSQLVDAREIRSVSGIFQETIRRERMKILGTGLSGLIGSRIVELLSPQGYQFEDLSKETGVDITDHRIISQRLERSDAPWVFHLAAVTDVQGAENERLLGQSGPAWRVNVAATENIATV